MKILHMSDLHGVERYYSWVSDEVRRAHYDALVVSGDLLNALAPESLWAQVTAVTDWTAGLPKDLPVFLVSGNHDKLAGHPFLGEAKWMQGLKRENVFIDGDSTELCGFCLECVGWGNVPVAESRLPKIVVSHSPPSPAPTGRSHGVDFGDRELSHHILTSHSSTWLVLCGHVHQPKRWYDMGAVISLNPCVELRAFHPSHIVIDTEAGTATWGRKGQRQEIHLREPA
jgi:Icc-related predicted phosphoesterase